MNFGKKDCCIEESPLQFQTYTRNQEQQHLYLHGDLQPQEELAPTKSRKEFRHGRKHYKVQEHYTTSNNTCALGGIVSGTDESSIFK